jgi:hypothetical protein
VQIDLEFVCILGRGDSVILRKLMIYWASIITGGGLTWFGIMTRTAIKSHYDQLFQRARIPSCVLEAGNGAASGLW